VTERGRVRRAEFAVAAFGATAFLLSLLYLLDAMRFHHDVLVDAVEALLGRRAQPRGGLLLLALALFDLAALSRAGLSAWRVGAAHRGVAAALPAGEWRGRRLAAGRLHRARLRVTQRPVTGYAAPPWSAASDPAQRCTWMRTVRPVFDT
jgi:hypothetical protein